MKSAAILYFVVWMLCAVDVKCTCPSRAETDDPKGRCCAFPFTYGIKAIGSHRTYYTCTLARHDRFWCSLDAKYKGNWANCVCSEYDKKIANCQNGGTCIKAYPHRCECPAGWTGSRCEHKA